MDSSNEQDLLLPASAKSTARQWQTPPRDRGHMVYIIFYVLGIGALLPWNFFSTATLYFTYKLKNENVTEEEFMNRNYTSTHLQSMFESYLSIAAMIPNVIFMFLNTAVTKILPLRLRVIVGVCVMIMLFLLTTVLTRIETDDWQTIFFVVTLATIVIMNAASAVLQGGVFGLAAVFPKDYTQAVMGGMGLGGIIAAVAYIVAIWVGSDPLTSGFGYFIAAAGILVVSLIGYLSLSCCGFALYHMETLKQSTSMNSTDIEDSHSTIQVKIDNGHSIDMIRVFKKIWVHAYCVLILFTVTLSCYPAVASAIVSKTPHGQWRDKYFTPVVCFFLFNFGDWCGRTLPGFFQWPKENSVFLPIICTLRVVFIPVFILCNVQTDSHRSLPVFFDTDWIPILTMILFSISNGHLSTLAMMYGPKRVDLPDIQMAGAMMSFFLALGLACGSLMSMAILQIVKH